MRILYDLAASQPKGKIKFHGGSEYCKIIFCELVKNRPDVSIEVFYDKDREIDWELISFCKEYNVNMHSIDLNSELNLLINQEKYDVVYSALPGEEYVNVKFPATTKFVFTQHGLRGLELLSDKYEGKYQKHIKQKIKFRIKRIYPDAVLNKRILAIRRILDVTQNKKIITDSFHSKSSILWYYPELKGEQIIVAAAPAKDSVKIDETQEVEILNNIGVFSNKYLLLVSANRWEKNNYRMIKALNHLFEKKEDVLRDYKVLVLGSADDSMYKKLLSEEVSDKFIFKGYVSAEELEVFYKNAYAFLYPSLNEGFGYPPIEVMKYGTMSICAADSSITEVCGDAVLYFNPYNINEMAIRVLQGFDPDVVKELGGKMKEYYQNISEIQEQAINSIIEAICSD